MKLHTNERRVASCLLLTYCYLDRKESQITKLFEKIALLTHFHLSKPILIINATHIDIDIDNERKSSW